MAHGSPPHGSWLGRGHELGYQDAGSWTLLNSTPVDRRQAAWVYAQFTVSKTVSLKKTLTGLTPIRESDLQSEAMQEAAPIWVVWLSFIIAPARGNGHLPEPTCQIIPTAYSSGGKMLPKLLPVKRLLKKRWINWEQDEILARPSRTL
ncbi:MAG: hypothetical protein R2865_11310 [Deinococcales bacterium]